MVGAGTHALRNSDISTDVHSSCSRQTNKHTEGDRQTDRESNGRREEEKEIECETKKGVNMGTAKERRLLREDETMAQETWNEEERGGEGVVEGEGATRGGERRGGGQERERGVGNKTELEAHEEEEQEEERERTVGWILSTVDEGAAFISLGSSPAREQK